MMGTYLPPPAQQALFSESIEPSCKIGFSSSSILWVEIWECDQPKKSLDGKNLLPVLPSLCLACIVPCILGWVLGGGDDDDDDVLLAVRFNLSGPNLLHPNFSGAQFAGGQYIRGPICQGPICRGPICRGSIYRGPFCDLGRAKCKLNIYWRGLPLFVTSNWTFKIIIYHLVQDNTK